MVEPGLDQFVHQLLAHPDSRRYQVRIEPGLRSVTGDLGDVAPRRGLAAGKMDMERAQRGGLAEHAFPRLSVDLRARALERQRIGAIRAAERTAMGELDEHADRRRGRWRRPGMGGQRSTPPLALSVPSLATASLSVTAP